MVLDVEEFVKSSRYQFYEFEYKIMADAVMIGSILEDRNGNIWMGGGKELFFWDRSETTKTNSIRLLGYSNEQGLIASAVSSLLEDQEGRIWIGSKNGISVWDGNNFTHFSMDHGLSATGITQMTMDYNGKIWIGTKGGGISIWDGQGFYSYTEDQGLPASSVYSFHIDQNQNIWTATNLGVIKLLTKVDGQLYYEIINEYTGAAQMRASDVLVSNSNKLWTVNLKNIDVIDLEVQTPNIAKPKLSIVGVQPFFDQFDWRQVSKTIIADETMLTGYQEIPLSKVKFDSVYRFSNLPVDAEFPYNINHLTFQWSSTYWADPTSIQYSYLLKGQDQSWSPLVKENKITYNDLDPGGYTLKVRAIAGNARWSDTASYSFTIRPPIWATWFAYTFYGLCGIGFVLGLRHYERKRFILKQKARSLEEVDKVKTEFFTNISHELRTPLTLILGPLKTLREGTYKGDKKSLLTMMAQNGNRLLRLVNQLLDLSKIDQGKLKLALENCDLNELAQSVVANFDSAASIKNIDLEFFDNDVPVNNWIDREKIKQVLFNLISNAIKFTPIGGNIRVSVASETSKQHPDGAIEIVVKDTGIGIPENELSNIFDRFYQVNKSNQDESEGTGIGLALVQKLVHLHNGEIKVESEPGWGTTFKVLLPVTTALTSGRRPVTPEPEVVAPYLPDAASLISVEDESNGKHLPVLLIVEDNAQMRQYIKSCLGDNYNYFEASNGVEGLKAANSKLPELILCDVMMPVMDGYEFCKKMHEHDATAHIPFIFLTAKADHESQIKGLKVGSVDYVIKPFDANELRLKIRNHLDRMQQFRSFFGKQLTIKGDIDVVDSLDERFLKKAIAVVEDHIDNHEFSVNEFSRQTGLSQTQLYRKLMTLTGLSPSAFIRSIRLKKAAQLILQNYGNTSDVTYAVGFNNLSYFAKCFKEQFGVSPSGYGRARLPNQTP
jgi:signal transduction histidine kinase/DNA-binding response OmpR family regulator